ncbi:MAG: MATE family efflux transporter [Burkholderiaceae bacterium]
MDPPRVRLSGIALVRRILAQAWPVLIGQWASIAFGVADTIMVGHSSPQNLAAMALGSSIYASVFVGLMGVVIALTPIIAQHFGGERHAEIGKTYMQGLWVALWLTIVGDVAMGFPDAWLVMSPVDAGVASRVAGYLHALMFALPAALVFRTVYSLNVAVSRPKVTMAINLVGLGLKIPLNYVLIYGEFGLPPLGAAGCGYATAIVMWTSCGIALIALSRDPFYRRFAIRFDWPRWKYQRDLLRLGIPTGLSYIVEVTSFTFMTLLVAGLGTRVTGGHQIVANLAAFCFMLPLSLAVATSAIVAQFIGANDGIGARRATRAGLRLAAGIALVVSGLVWFGRHTIIGFYTDDDAVAAVALSLIGFVAVFHLFDAVQGMSGFILRAYKHAVAPVVVYTLSLWGIGLVGGWWIAFHPFAGAGPLGAKGLWGASTVSLAVAGAVLLVWMVRVSRKPLAESR